MHAEVGVKHWPVYTKTKCPLDAVSKRECVVEENGIIEFSKGGGRHMNACCGLGRDGS